ncbi:MAG: PIN domain-containing protein [Acidobacteria bacterium]|nr:PIN domain-containing protein [Acidobacteriota bacterium]
MRDLLDVNVWIALSIPDHAHYRRAQEYWSEESAEEVAFCRLTVLGFLRLMTQLPVTDGRSVSVAQAWEAYRTYENFPEVQFLQEPMGCVAQMEAWARSPGYGRRLWTDAYLAAFAKAGGLRFVTFDRDFLRFPGLDLLLLSG